MTWRNDGIGSEAWWQEQQTQGIPRIEPQQDGTCLVTFFWRDPQGSETTSHTQRVWINITGVTDHHQRRPPQSLMRVASSDVLVLANSAAVTLARQLLPDAGSAGRRFQRRA